MDHLEHSRIHGDPQAHMEHQPAEVPQGPKALGSNGNPGPQRQQTDQDAQHQKQPRKEQGRHVCVAVMQDQIAVIAHLDRQFL